MPTYAYLCSNCNSTVDQVKKISSRDDIAEDVCPNCSEIGTYSRLLSAPMTAYSITTPGGYGKIPDGFNEVLKKVHKNSPGSHLDKTSSFMH